MGLFSRKPKQQPAAEQPPGSPLSPPEARYVNARPPTPQQHQPQFQQAQQQQTQQQQQRQQQRQQQASSDRPQQQRYQRAGPSRPESPLPQAPFQQPRASNSYSRPQHSQATFDRSSAALNSDVNDDGELDDGGRVRVGQSAMPPPATAASSSSSSASSYRWQPPSPPPLERESSDPARWQLPALGLSPPTSLAPLGLGLRTDDSMAGSDSNSLRGSASATSPPPPKSAGGSELGRGYPSSPATVDDRSRTSLPSVSPTTAAYPPLAAPSSGLRPPAPPSGRSSFGQSPSLAHSSSQLPPRSRPSMDALRQSSFQLPPSDQQPGPIDCYDDDGLDDDDDLPLERPPPLSVAAISSGPPSPASTSSSGKQPRRRFLGMFSSGGSGGESPSLTGGKGKDKAADAAQEPYGLAYESLPRSHGPSSVAIGSAGAEASHSVTDHPTSSIPIRATSSRPSAARRTSSSRDHRHPKSPTSPSFSIEAELAQQQATAAASAPQPTPREPRPRPSPGQRSSSFFANALRVSIPSSSKSGTSPGQSNAAIGADGRPPSPAESFRVISARRITTPDESLLLGSAVAVSASPLSTTGGGGGWLGARPRPGLGERKRSQSYEWTRASEPLSPPGRATAGVEELQSPEKDVDREAELKSRRVSVAAFRRRRSSAGFHGAASSDVLVIGREDIQLQAAAVEATSVAQNESAVDDSSDDDDKPLGMLRASGGRSTPTPGAGAAGVSPLPPPASSRQLPRGGSAVNLSTFVGGNEASSYRSTPGGSQSSSSGFSVPSRPVHHRGVSLTLPSPTSTPPSLGRDGGRSSTPTPADSTLSPVSATTPTAASAPSTAASFIRAAPPRSSSMLSLTQPQHQPQSQVALGRRDDNRSRFDAEESADEGVAPSQPRFGSQSLPASPKKRPNSTLAQSPGPSVTGLPVGSRPARSGGPIARPTSRYELAKAEAAQRKAAASAAEAVAATESKRAPPSKPQRSSASSSSDSEEELRRPASRTDSNTRARSPAPGLAASCRSVIGAAGLGKSPREPLLSLPTELEKPVLDRQRSIRRASVGDADQILSDVAAAKARLAAVAANAIAGRPQPATHRPLVGSGLASERIDANRPVARRRGSESVLNRMEKERLATHAEDSDTSDGYGNDETSSTPKGSASLATGPRSSFFKRKEESPAATSTTPPVIEPATLFVAPDLHRKQLDNADDSDSDDQPLGRLVQPSAAASAQTPARAQQHKALSSASNPLLRVTAASPQAVPTVPPKAAGKSPFSRPLPLARSTSTNSLSSLASSSSSSAASSVSVKGPPPKSILRRTSFVDEPSTFVLSDRTSLFSTSPSSARMPLQSPVQQHPVSRPIMSQTTRSVSASSIPSPTTSTQFPPRPAFHTQPRSSGSPSSSSTSGRTTGESSSSIMPLTPRESSELGRQALRLPTIGGKDAGQLGLAHATDEQPDEAELERKRNERRRNEAMKAVKLGHYANGSAPHPDRPDEDDDDDDEAAEAPASQYMPFPQLGQQPQPFHNPYANPFGAGGGMPAFQQFSPGGGHMPLPSFVDPNAMFLFQMQLQAQQAQIAMQMQMAQMGASGDPSMQYQGMMMAKAHFQQQMAAQAAQLAGDEWERSSTIGGGGGAMSEAGFPPSTMGGLGMGMPGGFNPAMNRFSSAGSMYGGGGGGPGYVASAYGGGGGGPDLGSWNPQHVSSGGGNAFSSSRSEYGGGASGSNARPRRDRISTADAPLPSRESFYGGSGHQSRSSTNLGGGGPAEHDYYQQSRIPPQSAAHQAPTYARQRQSSNPAPAGHRASFAGGTAGSKPLVSFSTSPPKTGRAELSGSDRRPGGRTRTPSASNLTPLLPPSAPFAREARPASPRSTSPAPPSSWKGSY